MSQARSGQPCTRAAKGGASVSAASYEQLPAGLPVPEDDGAAAHLPGTAMPSITLPATSGGAVDLARIGRPRAIVYGYPMTGTPGVPLVEGWDQIPAARRCTPQPLGFRDPSQPPTPLVPRALPLHDPSPTTAP